MPNPDLFYDRDGITIWHGDCFDVEWPDDAVVITDPPYGMNYLPDHTGSRIIASAVNGGYSGWERRWPKVAGDDQRFDPSLLFRYDDLVLFGANYYSDSLPPTGGWIIWDKRRGGTVTPKWNGAHAELAWTTLCKTPKVFSYLWAGFKRDGEIGYHVHPTQKPVALFRWILETFLPNDGRIIFDPYMGSGPVAQACLELGRRYVGIELVEDYCQAAVDRLQPSLFTDVLDAQS